VHVALVRSRLPDRAARADDPLADALRERGVAVSRPCWDDAAVAWGELDLAVVRTTWDYAERREEFLAWAERTAGHVEVLNPPDVLRWNTHKSYLIELEERGAPVVPTAWLGQGDRVELAEVLAARGWPSAVVKPAVGGGGEGLVRVGPGEAGRAQPDLDRLLASGDVLVQPYLDAVEEAGELSVVLVEGDVTHVVRKRPRTGEYRVHEHRGGTYERVEPTADVVALARWMVESTGQELVLARLDLIEDEVGALQVVELEATEPDLYLEHAPEAAETLALALIARGEG
jgi:glutathione synthase/RimK-type ligase-like ATP-grasp enzyme